jgi:5,5'-dehydrodivanillate O-demethylase
LRPNKDGAEEPEGPAPFVYEQDRALSGGMEDVKTFYGQDRIVWETQGQVYDRSLEVLGASDRGIVMFRRMLAEQIDRVERGEEPTVAVVRDPAKNAMIRFESATRPEADNEEHVFSALGR